MFPFSLGSFAFVDDLDDCSSTTGTYVERPPARRSDATSKLRRSSSSTVKDNKDGKRSKGDTSRKESRRRGSNAADTKLYGGKSFTNESSPKRSASTAPGRDSRRRSSRRDRDAVDRLKVDDDKYRMTDNEETLVVDMMSSKLTDGPGLKQRARSRETGRDTTLRATEPTDRGTKSEAPSEEVRKENRSLRRRVDRLEKDLNAYRSHVEHYRERRREA